MSRLVTPEGQQVAELAVAIADGDRLARGRRYQRRRRVSEVLVEKGSATALVAGSRHDPYRVTIAVRVANENTRRAVSEGNLAEAIPKPGEISLTCVCPDWGDPCKHGVAALLELAREIDDDPSLLLRWRSIEGVVAKAPPGAGPLVPQGPPSGEFADDRARRRETVMSLRDRLGSDLASPVADDEPSGYGDLSDFFEGAMRDRVGTVVTPFDVTPLELFGGRRITIEGVDAAKVLSDAMAAIADHWLAR